MGTAMKGWTENTVNQLNLTAKNFGGFTTFQVIIGGGFPYIILFNFRPNAKSEKFNSMPNLQYQLSADFR